MKSNRKILQFAALAVSVAMILSTAAFAITNGGGGEEKDQAPVTGQKEGVKKEKKPKIISDKTLARLYDEGYSVADIERAAVLSLNYNKGIDQILQLKGKPASQEAKKEWDQVEKEMAADKVNPLEALKVPKSVQEEMIKLGLTEEEMMEMAVLSFNHQKPYEDLLQDVQKGTKVQALKEQLAAEKEMALQQNQKTDAQIQEEVQKIMDEEYGSGNMKITVNRSAEVTKEIEAQTGMTIEELIESLRGQK